MATITDVPDGSTGEFCRTTWNTNNDNLNTELTTATTNITNILAQFYNETIDLVKDTDYTIPNPYSESGVIPRIAQLRSSDGTQQLDPYLSINQSTGDITIQVGADFTNAIIISIGW